MSDFISKLKYDHTELIKAFQKANSFGITTEAGKALLLSAEKAFKLHLQKEDLALYPVLKKASKVKPGLSLLLDEFHEDMRKTTIMVTSFYQNLEKKSEPKLKIEFSNLCIALVKRIKREEGILYEEYKKLITPGKIK